MVLIVNAIDNNNILYVAPGFGGGSFLTAETKVIM